MALGILCFVIGFICGAVVVVAVCANAPDPKL